MSKLLLLDEQPLVVQPALAAAVGLNEAIILQQLHYWLQKSKHIKDGKTWVYNTYPDWHQQLYFLSESTIRRVIGRLEKLNIIISSNKYNKLDLDRTKWYTINYQTLEKHLENVASSEKENKNNEGGMSRPSAQNEQTAKSRVSEERISEVEKIPERPSDQNEQMVCSNWSAGLPNLNRAIPEITTENTTEIKQQQQDMHEEPVNDGDCCRRNNDYEDIMPEDYLIFKAEHVMQLAQIFEKELGVECSEAKDTAKSLLKHFRIEQIVEKIPCAVGQTFSKGLGAFLRAAIRDNWPIPVKVTAKANNISEKWKKPLKDNKYRDIYMS